MKAKNKAKPSGHASKPVSTPEGTRPFWVPSGVDWDGLPAELQAAITAILVPVYKDLVLSAQEGLERATGLTLAHLVWLEILDQIQLNRLVLDADSSGDGGEERDLAIAKHLRLVQAKVKTSGLLLRVQEFGRKWGVSLGRVGQLNEPIGPLEALAELGVPWEGPAQQQEAKSENDGNC